MPQAKRKSEVAPEPAPLPSLADLGALLEYLGPDERAELLTLIENDLQARPLLPQPGPQQQFCESTIDIVIYGGAAFGGKSWALLYQPLQHLLTVRGFYAVLFRRTTTQIRKPGANWDESLAMYPRFRGTPLSQALEWHFPVGSKLKMDGLEHEASVMDWHSAQVAALLFDELTLFTRAQFFYMLSRNRSTCGVAPYVRAACNADANSWVAEFLEWWIDQDTGLPILERAGVVRWMSREGDTVVWADTREELLERLGPESEPKSVTFIPAKAEDNKIGLAKDPKYLGNLQAMPRVERERLRYGNWKIRSAPGLHFQRTWCEVVEAAPADCEWVRYWDLAATPKTPDNNPAWTIGVKLGRSRSTRLFYVAHVARMRESAGRVKTAIRNTATEDGYACRVGIPQDPGQAGKSQAQDLIKHMAGFNVHAAPESGDKVTRFNPFSAQAEAGNVKLVRGPWLDAYCGALELIPDGGLDDADASSGALRMLVGGGVVDYAVLARK